MINWDAGGINIDGTKAPDSPVPPYLDFRRSVALAAGNRSVLLVQGDWGQSVDGKPNMTWTYSGPCVPSGVPSLAAMERKKNPLYQKGSAAAVPVSKAEAARVLAGYISNTLTGFSGSGHWYHMWFFKEDPVVAYSSDDEDISGEGKTRRWWVGKDNTGYRLCPSAELVPEAGAPRIVPGINCNPLLVKKAGDSWVEHDSDGDSYFSNLPGRQ